MGTLTLTKLCRECGLPKALGDFHKAPLNRDGRSNLCKECHVLKCLWYSRLRKYGISEHEYFELLDAQDRRCAICGTDDPGKGKDKLTGWPVDHNHETGEVRGLLCNDCNTVIGRFNDNIERLMSAVRYLKGERRLMNSECPVQP